MEDREKRVGCSESIDRKIHDYSPQLPAASAFLIKGMQGGMQGFGILQSYEFGAEQSFGFCGPNSTIRGPPSSRVYKLYEFSCVALF